MNLTKYAFLIQRENQNQQIQWEVININGKNERSEKGYYINNNYHWSYLDREQQQENILWICGNKRSNKAFGQTPDNEESLERITTMERRDKEKTAEHSCKRLGLKKKSTVGGSKKCSCHGGQPFESSKTKKDKQWWGGVDHNKISEMYGGGVHSLYR